MSGAPKLGAHKESFWSIKDWSRPVSRITSWVGYHSKPMRCLINPGMPMSVIAGGEVAHNGAWETSRSRFGAMVTDPTGHKDMAHMIGNNSCMPEPMLPPIANVPTPPKARPEGPT